MNVFPVKEKYFIIFYIYMNDYMNRMMTRFYR